jgi:hypothetical protein
VTQIGFRWLFPEDKEIFEKCLQYSFWLDHCDRSSRISGHIQREFGGFYNFD